MSIRLALRTSLRDRSLSATVALTLLVATAANTLTFAVVNSVLLRPLPVPEADALVLMANRYPNAGVGDSNQSSSGDWVDRMRGVPAAVDQALFRNQSQTIDLNGTPARVEGMAVTPSFFALVRTAPALGRPFRPEEGEPGNERQVVLSHGLWRELYNASPTALGQSLRLGGRPYTVVGVMPAGFSFVNAEARLWVPLAFTADEKRRHHSNNFYHVGRLRPGATLAQVQAQVDAVNRANLEREPEMREALVNAGFHTQVEPLRHMLVKNVEGVLYLLWAAAILVLLIGGLNVTNLALARLAARRKEIATRLALGATRWQLASQSLAESLLMTLTGGGLGVALAYGAMPLMARVSPAGFPRAGEVQVDLTVVLVSLALAAAVGVVMGLLPVFAPEKLANALRDNNRAGTTGTSGRRARQVLVAAEVGFAFVLLLGAGLLLASFRNLLQVDPGYRSEGVYTASTSAPGIAYPDEAALRNLQDRLLTGLRQLPGLVAAGATTSIPLGGSFDDSVILADGYVMKPGESVVSPKQMRVSPGYFAAMGMTMVRGRDFTESDRDGSAPVIVIDEQLARHFWPGRDPVGQRMFTPNDPKKMTSDSNTRWLRVVGVVRSIRLENLSTGTPMGAYYFPFAQVPSRFFTLAVKMQPGAPDPTRAIRAEVARVDPQLALFDLRTMEERAALSLSTRRAAMLLALAFGALALFLAAIGIYGVLAYLVTQRRREIGIRVALGSPASGIVRLVLREGLTLVAGGVLLGLLGAVAMQRAVSAEIYGVQALDPGVLGAVMSGLGVIGLLACLVPARRALRVDPALVLTES
ncbi:MAG: ABC transporter permease [Bryobacteraceae bacterium]|nr:ABC transporter permease [Bryobacteraceae bacterium]